jgi:hypothetical protein
MVKVFLLYILLYLLFLSSHFVKSINIENNDNGKKRNESTLTATENQLKTI